MKLETEIMAKKAVDLLDLLRFSRQGGIIFSKKKPVNLNKFLRYANKREYLQMT